MRLLTVASVLVCLGCAEPPRAARAPVVYGEDGRLEIYEHPSAVLRAVAETSIAMKIDSDFIDATDPSDVRVDYTRTLGEAKSLCAGERFADQIEPGTCSGTLIDGRYLLTAGHCMDTASDCTGSSWLFGFRYVADGAPATLTSDDVYRCARTIAYFDDNQVDHAIVELDRPVVGHTPATVRIEAAGLADGTPLALIGHPNGIPMKIDAGGVVTWSNGRATYLRATVDAFAGNSGSGVFDHDGLLVALLRGGETDYVDRGGCNVVNVIDPPPVDDGESLTYLRPAIEAFCAVPGVVSDLCGCAGPCVPAPEGDTCVEAVVVEPVDQTIRGGLTGYSGDSEGSCAGAGPERVYTFTLSEPARLTARVSGFDSVLYVRDACAGAELACNDDIDRDTDRGSRVQVDLAAGSYFVFVDAYDADVDAFTLTLTFQDPPVAPPDAGPPIAPDAGPPPQPDAGRAPDAGATPPVDSGCSCRAGAPTRPASVGWLAGAAMLLLRRRRWRALAR